MSNKVEVNFCGVNSNCNVQPYIHTENVGKGYVKYGDDNLAPDFLLELYRNSPLQNALVSSKVNYITGGGFYNKSENINIESFIKKCNNKGDSLNDILSKCALDYEIFGGFALQIVYNKLRDRINEIYYIDISKLRFSKDNNKFKKPILFSQSWAKYKVDVFEYDEFSPDNKGGVQIFYYRGKSARGYYPEPQYIASIRDIQTNIEISKFNLNEIRNGLFPSLHISFKNGEPTEETKDLIAKSIQNWYGGSNNAGKAMITYDDPGTITEVTPVAQTDLNNRYIELDKTVTSAILKGHKVVSPVLFGVETPGQLGTANQLSEAYTLFKNTYVTPTQYEICRQFNYILNVNWDDVDLDIIPVEPINNDFSNEALIASYMSQDEIRNKLKDASWINKVELEPNEQITGYGVKKTEDIDVDKNEKINL